MSTLWSNFVIDRKVQAHVCWFMLYIPSLHSCAPCFPAASVDVGSVRRRMFCFRFSVLCRWLKCTMKMHHFSLVCQDHSPFCRYKPPCSHVSSSCRLEVKVRSLYVTFKPLHTKEEKKSNTRMSTPSHYETNGSFAWLNLKLRRL